MAPSYSSFKSSSEMLPRRKSTCLWFCTFSINLLVGKSAGASPIDDKVKLVRLFGVLGSESTGSLKDTLFLGVPGELSPAAESPLLVLESFKLLDKRRLLGPLLPLLSGEPRYARCAKECAGVLAKI